MTDTTMPDPWAALDALLTEAGIGTDVPSTGLGRPADGGPAAGAIVDPHASNHALPLPAPTPADVDAEQRRALTAKALQTAHLCLDVIAEECAAGGVDFDDAVKALPILHRVLEHVEKLDAARKSGPAQATAILTIILDDSVPQESPKRRVQHARAANTDVIDVIPRA